MRTAILNAFQSVCFAGCTQQLRRAQESEASWESNIRKISNIYHQYEHSLEMPRHPYMP